MPHSTEATNKLLRLNIEHLGSGYDLLIGRTEEQIPGAGMEANHYRGKLFLVNLQSRTATTFSLPVHPSRFEGIFVTNADAEAIAEWLNQLVAIEVLFLSPLYVFEYKKDP